MSYARKIVLVV